MILIQAGGGGLVSENRIEKSQAPEPSSGGGVVSMAGAKARVLNNANDAPGAKV